MIKVRTMVFTDILEAAATKRSLENAGFVIESTPGKFLSLDVYAKDEDIVPVEKITALVSTQKKNIEIERIGQKWSIYKRTLPLTIDKVVWHGLEREEAEKKYNELLEREETRRDKCRYEDNPVNPNVYDLVPSDANVEERSPFFNTKPTIIEEV